jgi:hypothetical protein
MTPAKVEGAIFRISVISARNLECLHSDGDKGVLRRWFRDGVMKERELGYADTEDDTTV